MPPKNAINKLPVSEPENLPGDVDNTLRGTIDSMGEGFALFGPDDRLIFCNQAYLRIHPLKDFIRPGVRFEDIIRENIKRGNVADAAGNEEAYIKDRLKKHRNPKGPIYRRMSDGSSFIINESRTPEGGTLLTATNVTALKQIEEELREREALTRHMLEASPVGVLIVTREGKHLFANERTLEIQGVTREELFNSDAADYYADPTERKKIKDQLYKTGFTPPTETSFVKPDGSEYTVIKSSVLLEFEGQKAHLTYLYDITDLKEAEREIVESRELFRSLADNLPEFFTLKDPEGRFQFVNKRFEEWVGLKREDVIGKTVHDIYPKKQADGFAKSDKKAIKSRSIISREIDLDFPDGNTRPVISTRFPVLSETGKVIGLGTVNYDLTDRIKAEDALRESEERLKDITDAALDYFWEMGPDFRFTFISERFFKNIKIPPDQIIGKTRQEFFGPETIKENPELWKAYQDDLDNRRPFRNVEFSHQFDDGQRSYFRVSGKPFFDKDENFLGYRGASTDITEYRRTERELTHHKKMESLGYLAGGMAHNLNNMLQPILILGQMTKENLPKESPDHQNLEIICSAAANAKELVERVSGFSRQQGMDMKSADIYEIIRDGLALIAFIVPSRITLKEDLDKDTGTVFLDSAQTQTVLINLIANAVDAMEEKKGELTITLNKTSTQDSGENFIPGLARGAYAKLSVTDTGHGMDEETLNKIFDPFFTTKGIPKGTGLGLSTAFGTIHKQGGTIRAHSALGKGTTFDIFLPLQNKS